MATGILMPKAGISVESCIITQWQKKVGDKVSVGEVLFSYETDKASFECESTVGGTLIDIFFVDGDEVPVLVNVCAVGNTGEDTSALRPSGESAPEQAPASAPAPISEPVSAPAPVMAEPTNAAVLLERPSVGTPVLLDAAVFTFSAMKISPRAKALAISRSVDPRLAVGTGPDERIIERDIRALMSTGTGATSAAFDTATAAQAGAFEGTGIGGRVSVADLGQAQTTNAFNVSATLSASKADYEDVAFTGIRKAISRGMSLSLSTIAQLTHNCSFNASGITAYRKQLKAGGESLNLPNITFNDMVLYAVSRTILDYKELNAHMLDGNNIRLFNTVNLGMAVDTVKGLLVPVIKNANKLSLVEIANEAKRLAAAAQNGTLSVDEMSGATFTISNLGVLGVESFTPVINPPQTGILGVCNIINRPYEQDGQIKLYPAMGLSLTYDHRAIDGAPASRFASQLCKNLENFTLLLSR